MFSKNNIDQKLLYYVPNEYVPVLIKKNLFKNAEKAVKRVNNLNIPLYTLDNFGINTKKPPNSFILFRNETLKDIKNKYPNSTSREISKIIGKMWNNMTVENKLPYILKANEIKKKHNSLYPNHKFKKVLKNLKQRDYNKRKEINNNQQILSIKKLLYELHQLQ
jgi:glutamyl/glutaminyl-tRNA synthetase